MHIGRFIPLDSLPSLCYYPQFTALSSKEWIQIMYSSLLLSFLFVLCSTTSGLPLVTDWKYRVHKRFKSKAPCTIYYSASLSILLQCSSTLHSCIDEPKRQQVIKILLSCRLPTGTRLCSVHGRLYNEWRIATCLWRCLHGWRTRRGIFLPDLDGSVIFGFVLHSPRRLYSSNEQLY
jgi:hypothetical protein